MTTTSLPSHGPVFSFHWPGLGSKAGSAHFPTHVAAGCSNDQNCLFGPFENLCWLPFTLPSSQQRVAW
jgi:hypothetical protein